jgi:EAL domain-containing protein (putative c-di-GMP-specific phosphodiesterase class I)
VRAPAAPAIDSVDAAELAAMQSFIKQLSAQLNPPKEPAGGAGRAEAATREAIGAASDPLQTSVDALRATADTLRAARQQPPRELHRRAQVGDPADGSPATSSATETPSRNEGVGPAAQSPPSRSRIADIREAIAADRLDLLLDPILGLGDRKARHFEVSVRVRTGDGQALDAEAVASMAPGAGLVPQLDAAKLSRSVRVAGRLQARGNNASLFSTLALESLSEGSFLDSLDTVLTGQRPLLRRLVLSFAQSDVRRFGERHWDAVARLAESGLRLALEHVTDLDMDFESLHEHGFDFVKLDADVFLKGLPLADGVLPALFGSRARRHRRPHRGRGKAGADPRLRRALRPGDAVRRAARRGSRRLGPSPHGGRLNAPLADHGRDDVSASRVETGTAARHGDRACSLPWGKAGRTAGRRSGDPRRRRAGASSCSAGLDSGPVDPPALRRTGTSGH